MTIGALPGIQARLDRQSVEVFLAELGSGLSSYETDYGHYPISPINGVTGTDPTTRDAEGMAGSSILYKELSGDFDENGEFDVDQEVYVKGLTFLENVNRKNNQRVIGSPSGSGYTIVDTFNSPIRYLAEKPNKVDKNTINSSYDLWSIAGTDPSKATEEKVRNKYITNYSRN